MNTTKRRIALLLELPDNPDAWPMIALRRCLKALLRAYGLRCLSIKEPSETMTFGTACELSDEPSEPIDAPSP